MLPVINLHWLLLPNKWRQLHRGPYLTKPEISNCIIYSHAENDSYKNTLGHYELAFLQQRIRAACRTLHGRRYITAAKQSSEIASFLAMTPFAGKPPFLLRRHCKPHAGHFIWRDTSSRRSNFPEKAAHFIEVIGNTYWIYLSTFFVKPPFS